MARWAGRCAGRCAAGGAAGCLVLAAGCSPYYAVTDTDSGVIHMTRSYDRTGSAVRFKDRVTRERVTVDNAEIVQIGDDEYRALLGHLRDQRKDD